MLKVENLHASVGDKEILKGINLTVKAGEVHAIMGPNGSGKSTLLRALAGLNTEYEGQIMLGEEEIRQLDAHTLSTRLALVTTERVRIANLRCRR